MKTLVKNERKKKLTELNKSWLRKQYDKINGRFKIFVLLTIALVFLITSQGFKNYTSANDIKCLVLDKTELPRKNTLETFLILKDPKNRLFEFSVFNQKTNLNSKIDYKVNQYYNFSVSEYYIKGTFLNNTLYITLLGLLSFAAIFFFIGSFFKTN